MSVSPGFAAFVVEQLDGCGPIVTKRMFGGVGIYSRDIFFAIIDNDVLYLKTDDSTRKDFEAAGSGPFRTPPRRPQHAGKTMMYYSVPVSVLEDADELAAWGRKAIAVAARAKSQKSQKKK